MSSVEDLLQNLENLHLAADKFAEKHTKIWFSVNLMPYDTEKQDPEHGAASMVFSFPIHHLNAEGELKLRSRVLCDPEHYKYLRRKHGRALHSCLSAYVLDIEGSWSILAGTQVKLGKYDDSIISIPSVFMEEPDFTIELIRSKLGDLEELVLTFSSKDHPLMVKELLHRSSIAARKEIQSIYPKSDK